MLIVRCLLTDKKGLSGCSVPVGLPLVAVVLGRSGSAIRGWCRGGDSYHLTN